MEANDLICAQQLEEVHEVLILHGDSLPEGVRIEQILNLILKHLVELLLEMVLQLLAFIRNFPVFLQKLAKLLEPQLAVDAPLIQKQRNSPADELILSGSILLREQLIVGVIDKLVRLLDLEAVGEGFDESGDELLIEVRLGLGGNEFVEGVGVVAIEVESAARSLEAKLRLGEEGEVVFQNIEVHQ